MFLAYIIRFVSIETLWINPRPFGSDISYGSSLLSYELIHIHLWIAQGEHHFSVVVAVKTGKNYFNISPNVSLMAQPCERTERTTIPNSEIHLKTLLINNWWQDASAGRKAGDTSTSGRWPSEKRLNVFIDDFPLILLNVSLTFHYILYILDWGISPSSNPLSNCTFRSFAPMWTEGNPIGTSFYWECLTIYFKL